MRSMIKNGSDDRPPNFVIRGTTKWWIPYDIRSEGAVHMRGGNRYDHTWSYNNGRIFDRRRYCYACTPAYKMKYTK